MNDTNTILQMAERIHELQQENKNQKIITDSYIKLHKEVREKLEAVREKLRFTPSYQSVEEFSREIREILDK